MFASLLPLVLVWQNPAPQGTPPPPSPPPAAAKQGGAPPAGAPAGAPTGAPQVVVNLDDRSGKTTADELTKALKTANSMSEKNRALEAVATSSHKLLVKPLATVIETDKSLVIRKRAAELLANQPAAEANAMARGLLRKLNAQPTVQADLVRVIAKTGYEPAHWADLDGLFERQYATDRVGLQEAILDLVAEHKERRALPMLLRNLDEPAAENVEDAANPPAEYWEARWKAWSAWRGKVKEALFAVTGQRFSTASEAKAWLEKNGGKKK